jgi:hypothetical protein
MPETFKEQCNTERVIIDLRAGSRETAGVEISQTNSTFAGNGVKVRTYRESDQVTQYR